MVPASRVPLPLNARANRWMWQTVEREGGNIHMGFDLAPVLEQAGLVVEQVRAEAIVQTPKQRHPVGKIIRAMLPRILEHGVATEAEIDIDTLDERLAAECAAANATYVRVAPPDRTKSRSERRARTCRCCSVAREHARNHRAGVAFRWSGKITRYDGRQGLPRRSGRAGEDASARRVGESVGRVVTDRRTMFRRARPALAPVRRARPSVEPEGRRGCFSSRQRRSFRRRACRDSRPGRSEGRAGCWSRLPGIRSTAPVDVFSRR